MVRRAAFYIDSHGFGHTTRSVELAHRFPSDWEFLFKTNAPTWLFEENGFRADRIIPSPLDVHPVHATGYRVDVEATFQEALRKIADSGRLVEDEILWLDRESVELVVTDISPLAIRAGRAAGLPAFGVSNFTWDWIFEPMFAALDGGSVLTSIREMMREATLNFRLPFSDESTFPYGSVDTPLLYRAPRMEREEARAHFGFERERRYVLLTFGGFETPTSGVMNLVHLSPLQFVQVDRVRTKPGSGGHPQLLRDKEIENLWHLRAPGLYHPDLVVAVDALVTKPGYGILSEAMSTATPVVLDSRHDFREFEAIYETLRDYPQVAFVEHEEIARLDLADPLHRVLETEPESWKGGLHGAEFIAQRVTGEKNGP